MMLKTFLSCAHQGRTCLYLFRFEMFLFSIMFLYFSDLYVFLYMELPTKSILILLTQTNTIERWAAAKICVGHIKTNALSSKVFYNVDM
jgi:hypothetical protein